MCLNYDTEYTTRDFKKQQCLTADSKNFWMTEKQTGLLGTQIKRRSVSWTRPQFCYVLSAFFVTSHLLGRHSEDKGNACPLNAMKVHGGSRGIAPLILNLGTRWRQVVNFAPRHLYPLGNNPRYALNRRLGGSQGQSQPCWDSNHRSSRTQPSQYTDFLIYFVLRLANAQLFYKLSYSYMFRHYRVILRQLAINTLPCYTSVSHAAVGNTIYN